MIKDGRHSYAKPNGCKINFIFVDFKFQAC